MTDMVAVYKKLLAAFPNSWINNRFEFIADTRSNQYFILSNCESEEDAQCKVLEWLSRAAAKGTPYKTEKRNKEYRQRMLSGINRFLGTAFSPEDIDLVYQELGNAIDHQRTIKFVRDGFQFRYRVKPEFVSAWYEHSASDQEIAAAQDHGLSRKEVERLALCWDMPIQRLMEQLDIV